MNDVYTQDFRKEETSSTYVDCVCRRHGLHRLLLHGRGPPEYICVQYSKPKIYVALSSPTTVTTTTLKILARLPGSCLWPGPAVVASWRCVRRGAAAHKSRRTAAGSIAPQLITLQSQMQARRASASPRTPPQTLLRHHNWLSRYLALQLWYQREGRGEGAGRGAGERVRIDPNSWPPPSPRTDTACSPANKPFAGYIE
ncbi:hypothetical protein MSG28_012922 [Choristoneura fumiferana]|uniref:Uncharacterized protein n=1 Tax=Choristoneura fumiferana TaxID=7141 RepID=A0ACC0KRX6_CHOFU|nr:hypothetical protein MSG28_012922 [Choristoneura fumiferana]